jgi:hypothetical protein
LIGFSCPSTAPVESAGCRSAKDICTGLAPSAVKISLKMAPAAKRIFRPRRSSGVRIGRREFEISRKPFSPQATGTTSRVASVRNSSCPISPRMIASKPRLSCSRKGREKRFISRTCGEMLMVENTAKSTTPWRIATSSRVWSPPTSWLPG